MRVELSDVQRLNRLRIILFMIWSMIWLLIVVCELLYDMGRFACGLGLGIDWKKIITENCYRGPRYTVLHHCMHGSDQTQCVI